MILALNDIGEESRNRYPGFGWCLNCGLSNRVADIHFTVYGYTNGASMKIFKDDQLISSNYSLCKTACGPLCEDCWSSGTFTQRLFIYQAMYRSWQGGTLYQAFDGTIKVDWTEGTWRAIQFAVMLGK